MSDKVKAFIESKGFTKIVAKGNNWNIDCPFCGDTKQRLGFSREVEGKWNCFNCGKKAKTFKSFNIELDLLNKGSPKVGEIRIKDNKVKKVKIKKKIEQGLADKFQKGLNKPKRKALKYLTKNRGFSPETLERFKIGSTVRNGQEYISIPFFLDGKLVDYKLRAINPDKVKSKWVRYGGVGNFIWNNEVLDSDNKKSLVICEAELDAMSLINAGMDNVVSLTNGAKSFPEEFYDKISQFKKIYLLLDNDEDGQYGAEKLAKRLGLGKCYNIVLPDNVKDVNEFFWDFDKKEQRYTLDEFKILMKGAKQFEIKGVMSIHDALQELNREIRLGVEDRIYGIPTPWDKLNEAMGGGAKPGQLIVVAARPKVGKSTILLNWLNHLDRTEGTPTLYISCEMNYIRVAQSIVRLNSKNYTTAEDIDPLQVTGTHLKLKGNLQIYYPQADELDIEKMREKIKEIVQKHGCKMVVFDNLLFMARGRDVSEKVGEITRGFKMLAEELEIPLVLITHPRKTNHNKSLTPDDLKDSASIFQDLDILILIHRAAVESEIDEESLEDEDADIEFEGDIFEPLTEIRVISRYSKGGKVYLNFNSTRGLFKDFGEGFKKSMNKKKEEEVKRRTRKEKRNARN